MRGEDAKSQGPASKPTSRSASLDARVSEITRSSIQRSVDEITRKAAEPRDR